ncbi:hypothetical protein PHYSODRAFT_286514 [Phytophthora sojae]|uniref:RxLR effector protein n=2 Tax=Phytophthora sojae TaxID=67593 RepID=G4ZTE9_PHYSP|nr:hypothetical protein PHYSODRAFT_286514 [Phytophthora sojae]AEK81348.1 Avh447 [Phytophthora sojae]AEK81349.1 Avh447 [Phytophthora sojae]EGZ12913.1 hypothetical protein PHYSODRAFT_286514 [Phytophthora sojae]|eukprot:XP_009530342.1 hypothetical protein PHYSODRAFT_286514 [Phytophthora sojae]
MLVVVFALSCLADALSATEALEAKTGSSATSYSTKAGRDLNGVRSLRVHTQVDEDDDEERAWVDLSAAKSKVRKFLSRMNLKDTAGEVEAKKALGLYGLSGKALKSHENYIYWRSETELAKFNKWASPHSTRGRSLAWAKFGKIKLYTTFRKKRNKSPALKQK